MKNKSIRTVLVSSLLLMQALFSLAYSQEPAVKFTDITKKAGLDFRYTFGDRSYVNILESSGSGVTVFDYNGDGLMDILMLNGKYLEGISDKDGKVFSNSHNELYRNKGNGKFEKVTAEAGLLASYWSNAAAPVDIDNDGDLDIYFLNYGPNAFYRNNGNGTFTEITKKLGLEGPSKLNGFVKYSIGASFFDYNSDGRLDVIVGNFLAFDPAYKSPATPELMPHPSEYRGQATFLYEQQPDGSFRDVTKENNLLYPDSKCMGLTVYDYDSDRDLDIFQANDHQLNFMFRNDREKFTEVGVQVGVAANSDGKGSGSMHGTLGDVNGDGHTDILVTDLEHGALYVYNGNGTFTDIAVTSGISKHLAGVGAWGAALIDYDNDGDPDIVSANGTAEELKLQFPLLLENDGKGNFTDRGKSLADYFTVKRSGRGLAVSDLDNDGDQDIIVSHVDLTATPVLLRNDGGNRNNWIGLALVAKGGETAAAGAKIYITAGGKKRVYENQWATSYLSNNDPRILAGLGKEQTCSVIEIFWPDGSKDSFYNVKAGKYYKAIQGEKSLKE